MVKIGFICEGQTETELVSSANFRNYLATINLQFIAAIDAKGSSNLLPHNISQYIEGLESQGAEKIIILTDLDTDACVTITKQRINARVQDRVVIAVKEIESWFLASTETMKAFLGNDDFFFEFPENELEPFETINTLLITTTASGRGIGKKSAGKIKLLRRLLQSGLDISQAATHPNCPSAAYFIKKLHELAS